MGAHMDEGNNMSNSAAGGPVTPNGAGTSAPSGSSGGGRGGFKKLFSRRKVNSGGNDASPRRTEESAPATTPKSLSAQRNERASKKGKRWTSRLSGGSGKKDEREDGGDGTNRSAHHSSNNDTTTSHGPTSPSEPSKLDRLASEVPPPQELTPEEVEARRTAVMQKQLIKERDGFCRRVDFYDGQVITVDDRPSYELGSYLGGGVAGVVYEGHRLRPMEEYPVRLGAAEDTPVEEIPGFEEKHRPPSIVNVWGCMPASAEDAVDETPQKTVPRGGSTLTENSIVTDNSNTVKRRVRTFKEDQALEMTVNNDQHVMIDAPDAPSRSNHYAKAVSMSQNGDLDDASISYGLMEETVAIKVLNPVGFRTLAQESLKDAVVARKGARLDPDVVAGKQPMEERHVWWLVNPNSRNLRTLQRYSVPSDPTAPRRVEVDRGTADRGLRISLVAAFKDDQGQLRELPLTRCIEIWGHVPFGASDAEFRGLIKAIDAINAGHPPPPLPAFFKEGGVPGRVATEKTDFTDTTEGSSLQDGRPKAMESKRTGIYRAATQARTTVYCDELKAYIALPAVPSKYIKWLRQRRAATKEIRNMMLIGRHRNVVHLFEVLELIQEKKSTMFLILELVRGGELFDLISSNAAKLAKDDIVPAGYTESETVMRKFFRELASGVRYCHHNGIAHRDLKPENLLVHNGKDGKCTLKIADFGLSAVFGSIGEAAPDDTTLGDNSYISSYMSAPPPADEDPTMAPALPPLEDGESPLKNHVSKIMRAGGSALSYFTCGVVDEAMLGPCAPSQKGEFSENPSPLKRMTSVVGSPHYVAPEIISQNEKKKHRSVGYDGTKADVWSAGVILYAMLFRSLPFGEDLLRCPRYQSFKKWYDEVKTKGRRASALAALDPVITEQDEMELLGPQWFFPSKSSPESKDLIVSMLNPDPDLRPTINMVLRHPWLLREGPSKTPITANV